MIDKTDISGIVHVSPDEVRRRFGSYWEAPPSPIHGSRSLIINRKIREVPGNLQSLLDTPDWKFPGTDSGLAMAKEYAFAKRQKYLNEISTISHEEHRLTKPGLIDRFRMRFSPTYRQSVEAYLTRIKNIRSAFAAQLTDDSPEKADVEYMTGPLRMRPLLDIGSPVWVVKSKLSDTGLGIEVVKTKIVDAIAYDNRDFIAGSSCDSLDIIVQYTFENGGTTKLDRIKEDNPIELPCHIYGVRYFRTKEAAEDCAREIAQNTYQKIREWL